MRPLEILLAVLLTTNLLWPLIARPTRAARLLPPLALIVNLAQLAFEGFRWQMIPLYLMTAATAALNLPSLFKADSANEPRRGWRAAASFLTLVLLALSTALPTLLPVPRIEKASGPYPVGTQTFVLTDANRRELYSGRDEPRKFMIQVWYPAAPRPDDLHAPWLENAEVVAPAIAELLDLPDFFLNHLVYATTPAFQNAPLVPIEGGYPVILFSHGWKGFAAQNSDQIIELASHGYAVVGLQHTYGAIATVFPDREITYNNPEALPEGAPEPGYTEAARLVAAQWAGDMSFTLDFLAQQNMDAASPFHGALDLDHVGAYGHSTGGGAVIQFCAVDARCTAGLTQDAFMTPVSQEVLDNGVSQPFFFFFSQSWPDEKNIRLFNQFYSNLPKPAPDVTILGTSHYDFSDLPLLSPLAPQLGLKGPINGKRVVKIINDYLLSYFNQTLKGIPSPIPFGSSNAYPELRWENR